ncbi:MAG: MOSC domain-containing protein [Bryobacteraceae bacterium]|nr:MOSC domain-containing protein [Bryobacteraceae bacterium]
MADPGTGKVVDIYIAPQAGVVPHRVPRVVAIADHGLHGDRYAAGMGTWSNRPGGGRQVTLIAQEDLDAVARDTGIRLAPAASRRNILTAGIDLRTLVGKQFWIGEVLCQGIRLCEPCSYLEEKTQPGVLNAFVHRAGLRADILRGGEIVVGDHIRDAGQGPVPRPNAAP